MPDANQTQTHRPTPSIAALSKIFTRAADVVPAYAGAFSRQTYHPQLGFLTPNEVQYARRYGWGTDRSR